MSTLLRWTAADGAEVVLDLDVATAEGYESSAEVTEHPVETGSAIADHVRPANDTISLEGIISNAPIRIPAGQTRGLSRATANVDLSVGGQRVQVQLQRWSGVLDRARECDGLLAGLVAGGTLVTLATGLRVISPLVVVRYRVDRSADNGGALPFAIDLKRVRVVSTSRVAVPAIPAARVSQNRGVVAPVEHGSALYNATRLQFPSIFGGGS